VADLNCKSTSTESLLEKLSYGTTVFRGLLRIGNDGHSDLLAAATRQQRFHSATNVPDRLVVVSKLRQYHATSRGDAAD
jgi:hypothetical protein